MAENFLNPRFSPFHTCGPYKKKCSIIWNKFFFAFVKNKNIAFVIYNSKRIKFVKERKQCVGRRNLFLKHVTFAKLKWGKRKKVKCLPNIYANGEITHIKIPISPLSFFPRLRNRLPLIFV